MGIFLCREKCKQCSQEPLLNLTGPHGLPLTLIEFSWPCLPYATYFKLNYGSLHFELQNSKTPSPSSPPSVFEYILLVQMAKQACGSFALPRLAWAPEKSPYISPQTNFKNLVCNFLTLIFVFVFVFAEMLHLTIKLNNSINNRTF